MTRVQRRVLARRREIEIRAQLAARRPQPHDRGGALEVAAVALLLLLVAVAVAGCPVRW